MGCVSETAGAAEVVGDTGRRGEADGAETEAEVAATGPLEALAGERAGGDDCTVPATTTSLVGTLIEGMEEGTGGDGEVKLDSLLAGELLSEAVLAAVDEHLALDWTPFALCATFSGAGEVELAPPCDCVIGTVA